MAITPFNLVQGPATLYTGAFGATEPADSAVTSNPNSSVWTDVGGIADGTAVLLEIDLTYSEQGVDQLPMPVGARLTKHAVQITAALAEATLTNMTLSLNQLTTTSVQSGYTTLEPIIAQSSSQPTYTALMIDGWAPTLNTGASARRRVILRKALSASKLALEYEKSKMAIYNTTWVGYYVSGSIQPWHVVDQTS